MVHSKELIALVVWFHDEIYLNVNVLMRTVSCSSFFSEIC